MDTVDINLFEEPLFDLSDDAMIKYAQKKRRELAEDIAKDGMPTKNTDRLAFLQTLSDMSSTAQANKRLDVDSQANDVKKQVFGIVEQLAQLYVGGKVEGANAERDVTPNDDAVPMIDVDPEVTKVGVTQESSDEFMARMSK